MQRCFRLTNFYLIFAAFEKGQKLQKNIKKDFLRLNIRFPVNFWLCNEDCVTMIVLWGRSYGIGTTICRKITDFEKNDLFHHRFRGILPNHCVKPVLLIPQCENPYYHILIRHVRCITVNACQACRFICYLHNCIYNIYSYTVNAYNFHAIVVLYR